MEITIIGTGNMARGIGTRAIAGGHAVNLIGKERAQAEEIASAVPEGARVVKAFNTTFAGTLVEGKVGGQPLDVFIAGDDEEARATVRELVESGGLRAIDASPLASAQHLEGAGFLHISVQEGLGTGCGSALKVIA